MKVAEYRGYDIEVPTSGGKAGKGKQRTSSVQVKANSFVIYQTRFKFEDAESSCAAIKRAKAFIDKRDQRRRFSEIGKGGKIMNPAIEIDAYPNEALVVRIRHKQAFRVWRYKTLVPDLEILSNDEIELADAKIYLEGLQLAVAELRKQTDEFSKKVDPTKPA